MAVGAITDEGIARLRRRIGIPEPHPVAPRFLQPGVDAFRQVAEAYGDDNPLWRDEELRAQRRVWAGIIAPPPLVGGDSLIGEDEVREVAPEHRDLMKGDPLRGVHAFYAGERPRVVGPAAPRSAHLASQRAGRACSTSRASSPSGPSTSGPGRSSGTRARVLVGAVPAA